MEFICEFCDFFVIGSRSDFRVSVSEVDSDGGDDDFGAAFADSGDNESAFVVRIVGSLDFDKAVITIHVTFRVSVLGVAVRFTSLTGDSDTHSSAEYLSLS